MSNGFENSAVHLRYPKSESHSEGERIKNNSLKHVISVVELF